MTPLIQRLSKVSPDAHRYVWFDLGDIPEHSELHVTEELLRLPFDRTAIVGRDAEGTEFVIVCIGNDGTSTGVAGKWFDGTAWATIKPFAYVNTPDGIQLTTHQSFELPPRDHCLRVMSIIQHFLRGLETTGTAAYRATVQKSHINKVRMAKGKPPLFVTWNTLVVAPSKPQGPSLGGTHASPRKHDRRGHWRNTPKGKRVWVRNCTVGDAAKGIVMKDYIVRTQA